jgi:signal transduction histidine kinase
METLGQVALAMNHEINNAINIIELQLRLLEQKTPAGPGPQRCLQQIHESLRRMTNTVHALKSVRRIVLTDYLPGVKMLDLERSQVSDADERAGPPQPEQAECQRSPLTTTQVR